MDPHEVAELSAGGPPTEVRPSQVAVDPAALAQPAPCPTCGGGAGSPASYVYAIGRIEARFPLSSIEKEFAQATGRAETAGQTDRQAFHHVLSQRENRYLARQLCWVLTVQGLETYILQPRDPADLDLLIEALATARSGPMDQYGHRASRPGRAARLLQRADDPDRGVRPDLHLPDRCAHRGDPQAGDESRTRSFGPPRGSLRRIMQMTDNAGATDEHRALNYLAMRYPAFTQGPPSIRRDSSPDRRRGSVRRR